MLHLTEVEWERGGEDEEGDPLEGRDWTASAPQREGPGDAAVVEAELDEEEAEHAEQGAHSSGSTPVSGGGAAGPSSGGGGGRRDWEIACRSGSWTGAGLEVGRDGLIGRVHGGHVSRSRRGGRETFRPPDDR